MVRERAPSAADEEWFAPGLRFACQRCGECCTGAPGAVWLDDEDMARLARALGCTEAWLETHYVRAAGPRRRLYEWPSGDCVLYDREARGCQVHAARPAQCRAWPFWSHNLTSPDAWRAAAACCPGCDRGELVPVEQIRARRWPRGG